MTEKPTADVSWIFGMTLSVVLVVVGSAMLLTAGSGIAEVLRDAGWTSEALGAPLGVASLCALAATAAVDRVIERPKRRTGAW